MKKLAALLLALLMALSLTACSGKDEQTKKLDLSAASWDQIVDAAKGTTVTFYGWGGDEDRNNWLANVGAPYMKEHYGITLEVVGMNIDEILAKLAGEKEAGAAAGSIDMIWINGENFYSAKENGLLYGAFLDKLPNTEAYIDTQDPETLNDFCMPIEGFEAPYGRAQMVLYNDSAVTPEAPSSAQELLSYPALPDFTGSAFVRNIIYELCGWEQFQTMEADYETVKEAIAPALDYLRSLNPYLWNEGQTFPDSSTTVDAMFTDGVAVGIENGVYTPTTRTFLFENGTIGNTNYMSIAFNAPNPAGALVVINAMISAGLQLSQYEKLRNLPVVSPEKLSGEEKAAFDAVDMGEGVLTQEELLTHRLPEMPAKLVPVIEEIWLNEVVGK